MNINIIAVGKLKEEFFKSACKEYAKRLTPHCSLVIHEIPESKVNSYNPSEKMVQTALATEAQNIKKYLKGYIIPLCIEGKMLDSVEFSETIEKIRLNGESTITFVIGGSFGLSEEIKKMGDLRLSMSGMTFPHHLARVMLLEQIYRSFQIISNSRYHK